MKRVTLVIGMVIIMVGLVMGGMTLHANASTPTLNITINPGSAPGVLPLRNNWTSPGPVALYMDNVDAANQVANATVASNGAFISSVMIGSTTLGTHNMIAVQGGTHVPVPFTITSKPPTDPVMSDIQSQVDNSTYGLQETKSEITDIQNKVNDPTSGLSEIKTEVANIQSQLSSVPVFGSTSGSHTFNPITPSTVPFSYPTITHVSLTMEVNLHAGDFLGVNVGTGLYALSPEITASGAYSYQFDATSWYIWADFGLYDTTTINWDITTIAAAP